MSLDANEDAVVGALKQSLVKSLTTPPSPPQNIFWALARCES